MRLIGFLPDFSRVGHRAERCPRAQETGPATVLFRGDFARLDRATLRIICPFARPGSTRFDLEQCFLSERLKGVGSKQPSQEVSAVVKQVVVKHVRTACSVHSSFQAESYYCGTWAPACLPKLGSLVAGTARRLRTLLRYFAYLAHSHASI
jgi:hypothetical protein